MFIAFYGYHRVSTKEQHGDRGILELEEFCKEKGITLSGGVFYDKQTGKNFNRPEYQFIRNRIQPGDTFIVTEMDRLGRNRSEILKELRFFKDKGVYVITLEIPTTQQDFFRMENSMARMMMETINNMLIEMYAVFAQVEIEKKDKRRREGIAAKKLRGEWDDYGRPAVMEAAAFADAYIRVENGEITATALRKELGLSHSTYYRGTSLPPIGGKRHTQRRHSAFLFGLNYCFAVISSQRLSLRRLKYEILFVLSYAQSTGAILAHCNHFQPCYLINGPFSCNKNEPALQKKGRL